MIRYVELFDKRKIMEKSTHTRKEAQAVGMVKYFTGKPCKNGHSAERYSLTGLCVVCAAELQKIRNSKRRRMSNGLIRLTLDIKPELEPLIMELIK